MTVEQWKNKPFQRSNGTGPQRSLRGPSAPTSHGVASPYHVVAAAPVAPQPPPAQTKHKDSVLDKFKLFNSKDKDANRTKIASQNKRTSSSSGFSSARSERSDSSASLCSDNRPPPPPPHHSVPVSTLSSSSSSDQTHVCAAAQQQQQQQRSIRSRFSRGSKENKESPRSSRRSEERDPGRGSPRSANRRERDKDSREREKDSRDARNTSKLTLDLQSSSSSLKEQCLAPLQEQQSKITKVAALTPAAKHLQQSSTSSCPSASSMVQSGIPQAATPGSPLAPGTGIPKPTAAVKGTAKTTPSIAQTSSIKEKNTRVPATGVAQAKPRNTTQSSASVNEDKIMQSQSFDTKDMKGSLTRQKQIVRGDSVSVAMVSPMPARDIILPNVNASMNSSASNVNGNGLCFNNGNQVTASESASTLSEASQNSCHSTNSNSSGSSVIYRPTSSENDDFDLKIINKHRDVEIFEGDDGDDAAVLSSIQPMQPLMRPTQYMRGIASLHSQNKMGMQEPNNTVPQKGMRISLHHPRRGQIGGLESPQSPHQQLPRMPTHHSPLVVMRQTARGVTNYPEIEGFDVTNGYMSDGDVLRPLHVTGGAGEAPAPCDLDGYMSEGGASLYAHKINQRFKEGIRQVQESMSKVQQYMHDDSFDDSSSLSSGVSDSLNEVCGGDDPLAPLAPLTPLPDTTYARNRAGKDVGLKLPVGLSGGSRKTSLGLESSRMYKVVSSKAHVVKKTESGQQTDSSAFKQISNTQWKKYVDTSKDSQRGCLESSGSNPGRRLEQRKPGVLGSPSIPSNPGFGFSPSVSTAHNGVGLAQAATKKSERQKIPVDRREAEKSLRSTVSPQTNGDNRKLQNPKTAPSNFGYSSKRTSVSSVSSTGSNSRASSSAGRRQDSPNIIGGTPVNDIRREGSSHSLERPRTKIKVSGGTQTTTNDLPYMPGSAHNSSVHSDGEYSSNSLGRKYQVKSYSLNGPTAAQLSQNVRERIMQSPYGKVHMGPEYSPVSNPFAAPYYRERSPRIKPTDGSLSDSPYANYTDLQYTTSPYSSPYMWAGARGNYPGSVASAPNRGGSMTEAESLESVNSSTASLGLARAGVSSLTQARLLRHQRDITQHQPQPQPQQPPPLLRSNSVSHLIERTYPRSTKSEKIYSTNTSPATLESHVVDGSMNIRGLPVDKGAYITSQPTSPTPPYCGTSPRIPMSPLNSTRGSPYYAGPVMRGKEEDCNGSSLSLVSSSSSLYSGQEDKHSLEVLRLRKDLAEAQDRVHTLASQLSTNAHVVAAFEHSLTNMTNRLQKLSATSERKDSELLELRKTIEALRQQSIDAGLTAACIQSMSSDSAKSQHSLHKTPSKTSRHQQSSHHTLADISEKPLPDDQSKSFTQASPDKPIIPLNRQSLPSQHLLSNHLHTHAHENGLYTLSKNDGIPQILAKPQLHPCSPNAASSCSSSVCQPTKPSSSTSACSPHPSPHPSPLNSPRNGPQHNNPNSSSPPISPFHCSHILPKGVINNGNSMPKQSLSGPTISPLENPALIANQKVDANSNSRPEQCPSAYITPFVVDAARRHTFTGTVLNNASFDVSPADPYVSPYHVSTDASESNINPSLPTSHGFCDVSSPALGVRNHLVAVKTESSVTNETGHTNGNVITSLPGSNGSANTGSRDIRNGGQLVRGTSMESVSSLSSACSATSHTSGQERSDSGKSSSFTGSGKKKGWLRSSFTKAFSRGHKKSSAGNGHLVKEASITSTGSQSNGTVERRESASDLESRRESCSVPNSPLTCRNGSKTKNGSNRHSSNSHEYVDPEEVEMLEEQLREQDMALTDIRLEALTSAHQLESLKETITKMRCEMISLKQDNERLQKIVASKSLTSSQSSLPTSEPCGPRLSSLIDDTIALPDAGDLLLLHPLDKDGKKVNIAVFLGCHGDYSKYIQPVDGCSTSECVIGAISISNKSKWDILDGLVKRIFKEYLLRVDPTSGLGLSSDSVVSYHLGEAIRSKEVNLPELLPCGYLVGEVQNIKIVLRGASTNAVDALAFETLIPKSIIQRYVSLLTEHRRIILCGPPGTGKTYLAQKLAEFLVSRLGKDPTPGSVATFNVDPENSKDLGSYLSHISEQCENTNNDLPLVIILDNLHHAGALTDVFNGFLSAKYTQCPYIIGTMNQATSCSTTNLQLHHNFRWVLMANHMEPVKGVLSRVVRRRLTHAEVEAGTRLPRLQHVLDWLPKCWTHINKFLETHSSSDVTLGPRLFLSCPGSVEDSQVWFTDLWNYSLIPYLQEAVREGLQLYGKRTSWEDPCAWLLETYPWPESSHTRASALTPLLPSDVGYDQATALTPGAPDAKHDADQDADPLFNMLLRLQEAANYSAPTQDSSTPTTAVALENIDSALESTL
ncbi:neuron navigator 2 [Hyalella azteca]|uniref:Neuron navigator 2 n=1 Tax=Hyalella azteca TaxID=294128 RepID=A0A979FXF9_HYAAZ|nr:neuron navigator 2 [Hyalella azteca]